MLKLTPDKMNTFMNIIVGQSIDSYSNLVAKYFDLRYKIEHIDEQDWYFRKGIKSNIRKLESLENEYLYLIESVNDQTLSQLQQNHLEAKKRLESLESSGSFKGFQYHLALHSFKYKVTESNILLELKIKYELIPSLEKLVSDYKKWAKAIEINGGENE